MEGKMEFDAVKATKATVEWIREWFEKNGPGCNAIIGISGGKDSSIAAALCVEALGKDRVIGVLMPNDKQSDIDMAQLLVRHLGIQNYTVNIGTTFNALCEELNEAGIELSKDSIINLPPRLRMSTLYAVGQSRNGRVVNTCNLSEDWVGYSTRYGDSVGDFSPMSCFTTAEIRAMGRVLGLPSVLIEKVPSDGLSGMSDEDKLGFTYAVLDRYIRTGEIDDPATKERIDMLHKKNLFKLRFMDCFKYDGVEVKADE
jgi:NAD+ synthase